MKVEKLAQNAQFPLLSLDCTEDFDIKVTELQAENPEHFKEFAGAQYFNWNKITEIIA